jgi:hypothetical protein
MEESKAREIAHDFARKYFDGIPFIENEDEFTTAEDNGDGILNIWISSMKFVPQEQADVNSKFHAAWIVRFRTDHYMTGEFMGTGHGRITVYIDAQTEEVWVSSGNKDRKLTAQEKRAVRRERWDTERNSEK